ncbi:MAG: DUF3467 domain-containing protein [Anaerolineales bacterium]|nr:DUF3467 domain-containing protein [Anaerolineales bacterium]MCW5855151.1 DUF3467 domain-containing protein [Anaerolineales bacterium]
MPDPKPKPEQEKGPGVPGALRPRLVPRPGLAGEAVYANVVRISHAPSELVFDFAHSLPGELDVPIKARVVLSPLSAKLLQRALADSLAKYETAFGVVNVPQGKSLADDLFRSPETPKPESE